MPGPTHEVPLGLLAEHPERLSALLELAGRPPLPPDAHTQDSAVRPEPVTADLAIGPDDGALALIELQLDPDERKRLRWPLAVAQVSDARRAACDLIVLTPVRAVAEWAKEIRLTGPLGSQLVLRPVVVHVERKMIAAILAGPPELAFFAAWAVSHRHGKGAREVVERAMIRAGELPTPQREAESDAILSVMNPRLAAFLKEASMGQRDYITEQGRELGRMLREREALAEARGLEQGREQGREQLVGALLAVLAARGVGVDAGARATIEACRDTERLKRWVVRASGASRVEDVIDVQ